MSWMIKPWLLLTWAIKHCLASTLDGLSFNWWLELLSNGLVVAFTWWLSFDLYILTFDACFGLLEEDWEDRCWSITFRSYAPWPHLLFDLCLYFCFGRMSLLSFIVFWCFFFVHCPFQTGSVVSLRGLLKI